MVVLGGGRRFLVSEVPLYFQPWPCPSGRGAIRVRTERETFSRTEGTADLLLPPPLCLSPGTADLRETERGGEREREREKEREGEKDGERERESLSGTNRGRASERESERGQARQLLDARQFAAPLASGVGTPV